MKRELNKEEIKFINFLDNTKKELTKRKAIQLQKQILNFKGNSLEFKALKRKSNKTTWLEVKTFLKAKYGLDFFNGINKAEEIGVKVGQFRKKVPDIILLKFQMFYLKIK